jgi:hypothetical protein
MKSISPLLLLLAFVLLSCQRSGTSALPTDDELVAAYAQVLALNEQYKAAGSAADSVEYRQKVQQVLSHHGFTEAAFRAGVLSQLQSAEQFRLFRDSVTAKLEERKPKP